MWSTSAPGLVCAFETHTSVLVVTGQLAGHQLGINPTPTERGFVSGDPTLVASSYCSGVQSGNGWAVGPFSPVSDM